MIFIPTRATRINLTDGKAGFNEGEFCEDVLAGKDLQDFLV